MVNKKTNGKVKRKTVGVRSDFFDDNRISDKIIWSLIAGILGTILMGTSDWLMIFGDVTAKGNIEWLTEGVANIEPGRNAMAMALAFPAVVLYAIGLFALKDVFLFERHNKVYKGLTAIGLTPWLAIHLFYTVMLFVFAWLRGNGQGEMAYSLVEAIMKQFWWIIPVGQTFMVLPFIYLMIECFVGKTRFHRAMGLTNPLIIFVILKGISMLLGSSPYQLAFTNGLMSESMLVFFIIYICAFCKVKRYNF